MSTDEYRYVATCQACDHEGIEVKRSDEEANETSEWVGFISEPADPYLVLRKRVAPFRAVCECGSRDIIRGEHLTG